MPSRAALSILFAAIAAVAADSRPTVKLTGGRIRGEILKGGGVAFKGIPYAQPPVGDLRWREPMPVKPWTGVRDATAFGAPCAQLADIYFPKLAEMSREDCLYLNIWRSQWPPQAKQPVMVWIHGGGNVGGSSPDYVYDNGESLARRGVIVVTFNYRLGPFGFFAHPALTRESPHRASGNQGILDQIAALKWVHENAEAFGGDANNVTIFGQSEGSIDAGVLMTSPLSKGLFRQVIGQSGTVYNVGDPLTLPQAEKRGEIFASHWKVAAGGSPKDLRAVSMADILEAEPNYISTILPPYTRTPRTWQNSFLGISIDGYVIPKNPAEVFSAGQEHAVALLLGNNSRENIFPPPWDLRAAIDEAYGPIAGRAQTLYKGGTDPLYGPPSNQWATDTSFRCSAVAQLVSHAVAGNPAWEYEFARAPPGREAPEPDHGSELNYVFATLDRKPPVGLPIRPTAVDVQISEAMQQYWTNFARNGNPNGGQFRAWPKFEASSRAYIQFTGANPIALKGLRRPFCDLFIENVKRQMAR
jgi:para-nitrobenzyl esterase